MSLLISTRAEIIKTKRSSSFWLSLIGAFFIPFIFFLMFSIKPGRFYPQPGMNPWQPYFIQIWQQFGTFLLPMFVILVCSLVPQIEYKNNAWKQVFASPQTIGDIFFSKYLAILLMLVFLMIMFNLFMILAAIVPNLFHPKFAFLDYSIDWSKLLRLNLKTFVSLLGIVSIQYWFSLRFKNFIVPIGLGLGLLITGLILNSWEHVDKVPYAFPLLTLMKSIQSTEFFQAHELNSIGYFLFFTLVAFADMRLRKERG